MSCTTLQSLVWEFAFKEAAGYTHTHTALCRPVAKYFGHEHINVQDGVVGATHASPDTARLLAP